MAFPHFLHFRVTLSISGLWKSISFLSPALFLSSL